MIAVPGDAADPAAVVPAPHLRLATTKFYRSRWVERGDVQLRVHTKWRASTGHTVHEVLCAALAAKFYLAAATGAPTTEVAKCSTCKCATPIRLGVYLPSLKGKPQPHFGQLSAAAAAMYVPTTKDEDGESIECYSMDASIVQCASSA
eukprot:TRINITY_DN3760_c0_g1_i2.p1 TRINITY_DN3760_c0_g1~~TRINITY_DN3760_c0_g1_i2.p1  ORF type:complete len:148 (+),score=35.09 TRINITY_DN3760_c0_g1_i2:252-695(+)